ncbi:hypothetical protein [Pinibacter soli]|uniref:Transposase n=1 Tax=Pinibacter soli TaxID=3044211 RepID=A0ABT6RC56_9BACT|nr:hypothetical protein [Pinibacter soli]MDI3319971.1 hypothetical protein [Pinibacter soli]
MIKQQRRINGKVAAIDYRTDKAITAKPAPKVVNEYTQDDVRYYDTDDGKTYLADVYDRLYKTCKAKINKRNHRDHIVKKHLRNC